MRDRLELLGAAADALRRAVRHAGGAATSDPVVAGYVAKVRDHAYRVTDRDIDTLRAAGMSDDAIFDVTAAAALAAADERLATALALLDPGRPGDATP